MGVKVTYQFPSYEIEVIAAPDVNDRILIDAIVDLYSDAKEDWRTDAALNKVRFPWRRTGAETLDVGKEDTPKFFLRSPWRFRSHDSDHTLLLDGAIYAEIDDPTRNLLLPRAGRQQVISLERPQDAFDVGTGAPEDVWNIQTSTIGATGTIGEFVLKKLAKVIDFFKFG